MKQTFLRIIFIPLLLVYQMTLAYAGTIQLPQTGQTTCWDASGVIISDCAGTGQDGAKKIGAALPTPRFVDNNNGTVTDTLTGLVWLKNANCTDTVGGVGKTGTWQNALAWSNTLASGSCDLSDNSTPGKWRLPNVNELESLINKEEKDSAFWLNNQGFTGVNPFISYWSSSTNASYPGNAWIVDMEYGLVYYVAKNLENVYSVLPVRDLQ